MRYIEWLGPCLIVVSERTLAAKFMNHYIWRVTGAELLPCGRPLSSLGEAHRRDEEAFIALLKGFLASDWMFYSSTFDLTRRVQGHLEKYSKNGGDGSSSSPSTDSSVAGAVTDAKTEFIHADGFFLLNRFIAQPFISIMKNRPNTNLEDFLAFCIEGFVEFQTIFLGGKKIEFGLISRRATGRVGTRYHSRGIDDNGCVSNFVETEQIVFYEDQLSSFTQIRGSIPLFWRQNINIRYKPPLEMYNGGKAECEVFGKHFIDLISRYGQTTAVNLVNHKGWEGQLAHSFARHSREFINPKYKYVAFDFNRQCPRMQWGKARSLLDSLDRDLDANGFFVGRVDVLAAEGGQFLLTQVKQKQNGVIRTNCIDCLDRTNLVQSFIARRVLAKQLIQLGLLNSSEHMHATGSAHDGEALLGRFPDLEFIFKQVWANNGDAVSKQYSGTGALKADFTRTGKRKFKGILADGLNSLLRYYLNNFSDGSRQDAMDLFYGHYTIKLDEGYHSPFIYHFDPRVFIAPIIMGIAAIVIGYFIFWSDAAQGRRLLLTTLFAMAFIMAFNLVMENGVHYVQYPLLRPPPIFYRAKPFVRLPAILKKGNGNGNVSFVMSPPVADYANKAGKKE